jgi:hypothetical protein
MDPQVEHLIIKSSNRFDIGSKQDEVDRIFLKKITCILKNLFKTYFYNLKYENQCTLM